MWALGPKEWKPICSSASSTVTRACFDKAAAAERPAIPPPMTRISGWLTASGGGEPLVDDLAAVGQADRFDDLVVVRKDGAALILVPEGAEKVVEVAGEQSRSV